MLFYLIEYQKKNLLTKDPHNGLYKFNVDGADIYTVPKKATPKLIKQGFW